MSESSKKITPKKKAAPKKEESKKEAPKQEAPKAEAPKKEPTPKAETKASPKLKTAGELFKAFSGAAARKDAATKAKLKAQLKKDLASLKK